MFKKNVDNSAYPDDFEHNDSQKIFVHDSPSSLNRCTLSDEFGSTPAFSIFDEKNSIALTPPSSEKSSEISVSSEPIYKVKSSQQGSPQVKYFFENVDSDEENSLLI